MAVEHLVRFIRPGAPGKPGDMGEANLNEACKKAAHEDYRLVHVQPVISDGMTVGWMLFFERPE